MREPAAINTPKPRVSRFFATLRESPPRSGTVERQVHLLLPVIGVDAVALVLEGRGQLLEERRVQAMWD